MQLYGEVATTAGHSHWVIFPLAQTLLIGPVSINSWTWGWDCSYRCVIEYWSMQRLIVRLGTTLFLEIFTFPASIGSPPKPIQNSQIRSHLLESGPAMLLAVSAILSPCSYCSSLWKSVCFSLGKTHEKMMESRHRSVVVEAVRGRRGCCKFFLFLVANVNLFHFWWRQLFHECPVQKKRSWLGFFNPELRTKRSFKHLWRVSFMVLC